MLNGRAVAWPEVAFSASPVRTWALVLAGVAFLVLGGALVSGLFPEVEPWSKAWFAGWICVVYFAAFAVFWSKQALTRGPVVTVGPRGVRDTRVSPDWIPWSAIEAISVASVRGTRFPVLRVDPAFEAAMRLTRVERLSRSSYAGLLGDHTYAISPVGLRGSFEALKHAIEEGWARARDR